MRKRSRIYILPTKMGGYLNGLIFLMFLLAIGYSNNLLLIFTLFLFGMNLIWVIQTHFHLRALKLQSVNISDGHAGELNESHIVWKKTPKGPYKWEFALENDSEIIDVTSTYDTENASSVQLKFPKRGVWYFKYLKVKTEMPFGLYQVWIYLPLETKAFAYPAKLKDVPPLSFNPSNEEGSEEGLRKGPHDVKSLSPYMGEESRRISWKHYARTGELLIKEGEQLQRAQVVFKLQKYIENKEIALSELATLMVHCANSDTSFTLESEEFKKGPRHDQAFLQECLRELAKC